MMKASKESIENLVKNASLAVGDMYPIIKQDICVIAECDHNISPLLKLVPELRMNVRFILVDLESSFRALINAESAIEKRFHLVNIRADIHESYKLLYGNGKSRQSTVWSKIGNELQIIQKSGSNESEEQLRMEYDAITPFLIQLKTSEQDKDNRNLTYHYDDNLLEVYQNILEATDEEEMCRRLIPFFDSLLAVLVFCDHIELIEKSKGYVLPMVEVHNDFRLSIQKLFAKALGTNLRLQLVTKRFLENVSQIDAMARTTKKLICIQEFAKTNCSLIDFPEAENMVKMSQTHLLIQLMLVNIASDLNAYFNSGSEPEYAFILRRLIITRFAVLSHLFGYCGVERENSLWSSICKMIPNDYAAYISESKRIQFELEQLIEPADKKVRNLYTHLMNRKKNNVPAIITKMEESNPIIELKKTEALIRATTQVSRFLKALMDKLAKDTHARAQASTEKVMTQLARIRDMANDPTYPEHIRISLNEQVNGFEKLIEKL